jgi:hypothetical protein
MALYQSQPSVVSISPPFDFLPADRILFAEECACALTRAGLKTSPKSLPSKASRGDGPPYHIWGRRRVYVWGEVVEWAIKSLGCPVRSAAERRKAGKSVTGRPPALEARVEP